MKTRLLFEYYFSRENLTDVFRDKISHTKTIGLDKITADAFESHLDEEISIINRKIGNFTYHFTPYRQILISKGAQKYPREISISTIRDRLVLTALNQFLVERLGNSVCQTQLPQSVIQSIVNCINAKCFNYYLKFDISHFYSSLDHTILVKKVRRKLRLKEAINLIKKAIETPTKCIDKISPCVVKRNIGTPEGIPISNTLANLYLQDVDCYWKKQNNVCYYRYVDDILIFCQKKDADLICQHLTQQIRKLKLNFNDKTEQESLDHVFTYLGYKFSGSKVSVRESSVLHLEKNLESVFSLATKGPNNNLDPLQLWKLNLKITGFIVDKKKYGWLFYFFQLNDLQLLSHLDWLIQRLFKRYGYVNLGQVKHFHRAYYEIRYNLHKTNYIPNFNNYTFDDKRNLLVQLGINFKKDDVENAFHKLIVKASAELEKDVQPFS